MQSNYSTEKLCAARRLRWDVLWTERKERKKEKKEKIKTEIEEEKGIQEALTSGKKTDCENLRIPLSAQSDEKRGCLQFSSEIYDGRSRKLNTNPGNL